MTQLSGTEPAAADTTTVAPQGQPASDPAPAAAGTLLREDQVAIDKSMLAPFGGDTHELLRKATAADNAERQIGLPLDSLVAAYLADPEPTTPAEDGSDPAAAPVVAPAEAPATETPAPMTEDAMNALLDKRDEARAAVDATAQDKRDRASTEATVAQDKGRHFTDALKAIGVVPNEQGEWPKRIKKDQSLYEVCLDEAIMADLPAYDENDAEAMEQLGYRTSPTEAQVARALDTFKTYFVDIGHKAVADFAQGQSDVPGATVGPGAGGGAPPKKPEDMTHMEELIFLTDKKDLEGYEGPTS